MVEKTKESSNLRIGMNLRIFVTHLPFKRQERKKILNKIRFKLVILPHGRFIFP